MSRTYCHTHSAYDCPTCADEILSLGIQADKDRIAALERELERLRKDAELGKCIHVKFRLMKGSTAVRFLGCLGVNEPEGGFDWSKTALELIDAAIAQDKGE